MIWKIERATATYVYSCLFKHYMIKAIIVDDEPYSCESLATLLEQYCPAVKTVAICHSGEEALAAIETNPPQILFLDIEMPKMNG